MKFFYIFLAIAFSCFSAKATEKSDNPIQDFPEKSSFQDARLAVTEIEKNGDTQAGNGVISTPLQNQEAPIEPNEDSVWDYLSGD